MNKESSSLQYIGVALFFIFGVALIYYVFQSLSQKSVIEENSYQVRAVFKDIKQIAPTNAVRVAGVSVGSVEETYLENGRAVAILKIRDEYRIPEDSVATIAIGSLLGNNYIGIEYGESDAFLAEGASMETEEATDINAVFKQIGEVGKKIEGVADNFTGFGDIDIESLNEILAGVRDVVEQNDERLTSILENVETVTMRLEQGEGTIGKLIKDDEVYNELIVAVKDLRESATTARETLSGAQEIMAQVRGGEGTLGKLIYQDTITGDVEVILANMKELSDTLNQGEGTLGKLIKDDELYLQLKSIVGKAERAVDGVSDSGPVSAVGVAANALF